MDDHSEEANVYRAWSRYSEMQWVVRKFKIERDEARRQLAEAHTERDRACGDRLLEQLDRMTAEVERDEATENLAEAAKCVRLLMRYTRHLFWWTGGCSAKPCDHLMALPAWMRKWIEG